MRPADKEQLIERNRTFELKPANIHKTLTVWGRNGSPHKEQKKRPKFTWHVERGAPRNYAGLGSLLAACGDLYRHHEHGHALIQVLPDGKTRVITKGSQLAPVIVDRVKTVVMKDGKTVSELPPSMHLNAMLRTEAFLSQFHPLDEVTVHPLYLDNFDLVRPGYNDGGSGRRVLYLGPSPEVGTSTEAIDRFLDVMAFASTADRTNTVAAALTVLLRRNWLGQKPVILVTATKSHAGKGTITEFFRGNVPKADVLYEATDWPMQSQFQRQAQLAPDIGLVIFDNVRCDSSGRAHFIRSGFIESFVTNAEVTLASPGVGEPIRLENRFVVTINTNDGKLSPDLMNRALSIHLAPHGTVHEQDTAIGNPKWDYLPRCRAQIEAELRGMIERWKVAGRPVDENVRHSMTPWARTIGGILAVNGFQGFLGNSNTRRTVDDPAQEALAILGVTKPGKPLKASEWAEHIERQGLAKILLPPNERETKDSRTRATGVLLSKHLDEEFIGRTDTVEFRFRLEGGVKRWLPGKNAHARYIFTVLKKDDLPYDDGPERKLEEV